MHHAADASPIHVSSVPQGDLPGLSIARLYTVPGITLEDVFHGVEWTKRTSKITEVDGSVVFEQEGVEVPAFWSQLATDILAQKYFRRAGLPGGGGESSLKQVVRRIVNTIVSEGIDKGYFATTDDADIFAAEMAYMLVHQIGAFNSPVWFNVGLWHAYGIVGSKENFQWDHSLERVVPSLNDYARPQSSACMPYGVLVNTNEGLIPIGEIVERFAVDPLTAISTYDRYGAPTRIVAAICNGKRYVMNFDLADGTTLSMTSDHRVFVEGKDGAIVEKLAGDLVRGVDRLVLSREPLLPAERRVMVDGFEVTADLAWITGVMIGNGFSGRPPSATSDTWELKVNTPAERKRAEDTLSKYSVPFTTSEHHWGFTVRGYGEAGRRFWDRLGVWNRTGSKEVPSWAFRSGQNLVGALLQGLFDTDGTVNQVPNGRVVVQLANTSRQVIESASSLLRALGIFSSLNGYEDSREDHARKEGFTVSISDVRSVDLFAERVGLTHEGKRAELDARNPNRDAAYRRDSVVVEGWRKAGATLVYDIQTEAGEFWADGRLVHNCFILGIEDSLSGIYANVATESRLFRHGSGVGCNFSVLRGRMEKLSSGGTSSGLMSFLEVFDKAAGSTKSGGVSRRAAKMVCLDADHPEIFEFVRWKEREEKKAMALVAQGYPSHFDGEAYRTVSGQNSNNSVRLTDEFFLTVKSHASWSTTERTTGKVVESFPARQLWDAIGHAAWACADPGVQYHTTINRWHTCPNSGPITASNPCAEYVHLNDSACNLASLRLTKFLLSDGQLEVAKYRHAIRLFFIAQEILVDLASYPTAAIAQNAHDFRQLGIGYADLGAFLMKLGLSYDSHEGRSWAGALTAILTGHAYRTSAEIARVKGSFAGFDVNRKPMLDVMSVHTDYAERLREGAPPGTAIALACDAALSDWEQALDAGYKYGYRNSQASAIAPTGTIGLLMDCDTTGVEPEFSLVKFKKLAGGGSVKIINQAIPKALERLGYSLDEITKIVDHVVGVNGQGGAETVEGAPHLKAEHYPVFDCANRCGVGTRYLKPMAHLSMMAAVQPFVSGAISKTVNVPNEATEEEIKDLYWKGWEMGLKAVAIYRDGSKGSQPLTTVVDTKKADTLSTVLSKEELATQASATVVDSGALTPTAPVVSPAAAKQVKMPRRRFGVTRDVRVGGHKIFLRTGEYPNGRLGEIFIDMHKEGAAFRSLMNCLAISVSAGLQHGVPLEVYVDKFTFTRFEPHGMVEGHERLRMATSLVDYVFRSLAIDYLGRDDLAHVQEEPASTKSPAASLPVVVVQSGTASDTSSTALAKRMGDSPPCDRCGGMTIRTGACWTCTNCGTGGGCG